MLHPSSSPTHSKEKLLRLFDEGHRLSYAAIRRHVGIGERQARRLVKALQSEVSGLRTEWVGGVKQFWLAEEHRRASIDHIAFTETESLALAVAASAARATFAMAMTLPGQTVGLSLFIDAFIAELSLSRATISLAYTVATVAAALLLPLVGRWIDRYGPRRVVVVIAVLFGLSCIWMGLAGGLLTLFIGFVLMALR